MRRPLRFLALTAVTATAGCGYVVQEGVRALVGDEEPPGSGEPYAASAPAERPSLDGSRPPFGAERPRATVTGLQWAPTLDWRSFAARTYTPGQSLFSALSEKRMPCQAVPVGLAQAFSGPTGPSASPLTHVGPIEVGVAGPNGAVGTLAAWDAHALSMRAMASGARMAGEGPSCATRLFFYVRIGGTGDEVSVLR